MAGATAKDTIALRYRLVHELGKGGMGTVWKAHDDRLNRDVALKLMAKRLLADKTAVDRFEREAKAVARLLSPHIVQIYDYGIDPQPFMVMELLEGENVSQRLTREGQLPLDEVALIMRQSAHGLATAHEAGIVHRDLKPGNLFIVRDRDSEFVKVVDFGIAKAVRRQVTLTAITTHNQPVGTPQYMSPNQLRAKEDHRDDVWSLAVIAYKALCGVHPFASDSLVTLVQRIMDDPHEPVTSYEPSLPASIDAVFDRAFAKDREERYQSAPDFADAFDALLTGVPEAIEAPARRSEALSLTSPLLTSDPPPPGAVAHPSGANRQSRPSVPSRTSAPPPVYLGDEESTTEVTLVRPRPSRPSRPSGPPRPPRPEEVAPTLVDDNGPFSETEVFPEGTMASWNQVGALNVPTPTPPPAAAGTPWPVAGVRTSPALGPIAAGIALSVVTVAILIWWFFPTVGPEANSDVNPPQASPPIEDPTDLSEPPDPVPPSSEATTGEPDPEPGSPSPITPTPQLEPKSATLPSATASQSAVIPQPPAGPTPGPTLPSPVPPKKKKKKRKKKKGDEAFEGGPF